MTLLLICGLVLEACSISPSLPSIDTGNKIILKYADQNSSTGWEGIHAAQPWLNQITAVTNGRVQIDPYYSESLIKGIYAWDATKIDITDMAWVFHGYWADNTPLSNVISLPFLPFTSARQASGIYWKLYQKYPTLRNEYKDNHVLLMWASTPYFLVTSKKQVRTLDDLKGLKIRVPTGPPVAIIKAIGAIPVTIGMPDTFLYLQKGVIDGIATSWEILISYRQYTLVNNYTFVPLFTVYFTQVINNSIWNSLPTNVQDQINSVSSLQGSLFWGENMFDSAASAGRNEVKKQGSDIVEYNLPADEMNKFFQIAGLPLWNDWIKQMIDSGHPEAQDILNTTLELIKTYNP